ncbi:MAG TPA: hypothetical protein PLV45_14550, partial [bacterium]|nr:hypothetical protein [bacterium]
MNLGQGTGIGTGIVLFAAIVVLPGIFTTLIMIRNRDAEWYRQWAPAVWFMPLPAGFMAASILMEILEFTHRLSLGNVLSGAVIYTGVTGLLLLRRPGSGLGRETVLRGLRRTDRKRLLWPLAAVTVYMFLTVYPFDFMFETTDSGVYVASGIHAFKTGSFRFVDPELIDASPAFRETFTLKTPHEYWITARDFHFQGIMGTGFVIRSYDSGLIEPRYFNLHPFWIGLFVEMFGLEPGMWLATPFTALCGISGIFLLAWALAGWSAGMISLALLSIFVLQVWFGRYITTEMPMQAAIMNGLAWFLIFRAGKRSGVAMVAAGTMLATAHFARIDSVLIIPAVAAAAGIVICTGRSLRDFFTFGAAYTALTVPAVFMAVTRFHSYTLETLRHVRCEHFNPGYCAAGIAAVALAVAACLGIRRRRQQILTLLDKHRNRIWSVILIIAGTALVYGYVLRPILHPPDYTAFHQADQSVKSYSLNQMTLRWLGWYLSPPGLFAACAGLLMLLRKTWSVKTAVVWSILSIYIVYFMHKIHCTPYHYWGMRRYITVVFPVLFIGLGTIADAALTAARN